MSLKVGRKKKARQHAKILNKFPQSTFFIAILSEQASGTAASPAPEAQGEVQRFAGVYENGFERSVFHPCGEEGLGVWIDSFAGVAADIQRVGCIKAAGRNAPCNRSTVHFALLYAPYVAAPSPPAPARAAR